MRAQGISKTPRVMMLGLVMEAVAVGVFIVVKALAGVVAEILLGFGG